MQDQTQTGVDVFHLAFGDEDDEERNRLLRDLRGRIRHEEDYAPTQDDFEMLWSHVGHDAGATLNNVFGRWNAGSGQESAAFARRECEDCDAVFTGEREAPDHGPSENPISLQARQRRAEKHERQTKAAGDAHTVGHGTRSLSVGDIVVAEGTAHLVAPFEMREMAHLDVSEVQG